MNVAKNCITNLQVGISENTKIPQDLKLNLSKTVYPNFYKLIQFPPSSTECE